MKKKISILIPCYNEAQSLPLLYDSLVSVMTEEYDWEVLLIDDGSKDNTVFIMEGLHNKDERFSYLELSRNFGKEKAMLAGFDYVTGDCTIIMDADLQHPSEAIPQMIKLWEEGYEDVYGKRKNRGNESYLRRKFSLLFYYLLQKTAKYDVLPNVGDFRLLDKICIKTLRNIRESERYTKGMFAWIGFKKIGIEFETKERTKGKSSWSFRKLFGLAIEGLLSFTTAPLRLSTVLGAIVSLSAFIYLIYVLIKTLIIGNDVAGFPTMVILILFLGGVQLLSLGIIGEYVGRIFIESKKRPTYVVRKYNGKKEY